MNKDPFIKKLYNDISEDLDFYNVQTGNLELEVLDDILDIVKLNLNKCGFEIKNDEEQKTKNELITIKIMIHNLNCF